MHSTSAALSQNNPPVISIVMPAWNAALYLRASADSILAQTIRNFEFIIIDDGSTDDTVAIVESYRDTRIRLIRQKHLGIVAALNKGVEIAESKWIARMDADDIAMPDRLEKQLGELHKHPEAVFCHTGYHEIDSKGTTGKIYSPPRSASLLTLQMCHFCPITHPTVVFRKDAFLQSGGYREDERHAEDYGLWGRLLEYGSAISIREPLLLLRKHSGSISVQARDIQESLTKKIASRHCGQFMNLSKHDALLAADVLMGHQTDSKHGWKWFFIYCLPRLKYPGLATWIWCARLAFNRSRNPSRRQPSSR